MRTSVALVAAEDRLSERCRTRLLRSAELDLVASAADTAGLSCSADVTVIACSAADPWPEIAQVSLAMPGSRLVAVLPTMGRQTVRRAIHRGVAALVRAEDLEDALVLAVHSARAGQLSIPLHFAACLEKPILSSREKQILGLVVMGFTNGQIARRLFLAESTVKSHMSSILAKLGVCSRKEAAAVVLDPEQGLGLGILSISEPSADPFAGAAPARVGEETAA